ncbi:MAG: histidine kinase [Ilumatobacter sp.]|uniref:sensor histidine kinase n=1 Tax=Ilumatobacter sp. TaxID=1967498 RepID=UPI003C7459A7
MTKADAAVTPREPAGHDNGDFLRRAARAHHESALFLSGGAALDGGLSYTVGRLADVLGASRAFFAMWAERGYLGRALVGASSDEQRSFLHRPLPALPIESRSQGEVARITDVSALRSTHPWLADLVDADDVVLAVGTWAGQHPTCVIGLAGLRQLDDDRRLALEGFLMMLMGAAIGETLVRQRNRADLRRGEALDTLVDELDGERRRISHEIHDGVLQSVSSIAHFLETLSASSESEATRAVLERLRLEAQNSAITLRRIVNDFEPEQLAEESTTAQIRSLTTRVTDLFGLEVNVEIGDGVDELALARPVLRVLRQALDNIITHADAAVVGVEAVASADDELTLTIDDDGTGIENDHPWDLGVGLRSMNRVVNEHGGVLTLGSPPHSPGTRLIATFAVNGPGPRVAAEVDGSGTERSDVDDEDLVQAVRQTTLSLLDQNRRPTITLVAESIGVPRRTLLARFGTADAMIVDATTSLADSIEKRWAAFEPFDRDAPFETRLDALLERRFAMEEWGRPIRLQNQLVDPSPRFDAEVHTAFRPEFSIMQPAERDQTGRLVAWLFRPRSIRAIISDVTVDPAVARDTIRSVATSLLRNERSGS